MNFTRLLRRMSGDPAIQISEMHFCVGEKSVAWSSVHSIKAYKLDLVTVDEVRLFVAYDGGHTVELSEEQDGYETFIAKAEHRYGFPEGWWTKLVHPAFKRNEMTLFYRDAE